jgi:two-component system KDP operon response regulator KdpE
MMGRPDSARLLILATGADPESLLELQASLESLGHQVVTAAGGPAALSEIREEMPDLVILDMTRPGPSGPELCHPIREAAPAIPIIVLSSNASESDRVAALDLGADDCLTKPFGPDELLARIRAVLRRSRSHHGLGQALEVGDFSFDRNARRITLLSKEIGLTPKEFDILSYLLNNPRKVVTQRELLLAVWGPESAEEADYLRVYVSRLRRKIEPDPAHPRYILTVPWVGYRMDPAGPSGPSGLPLDE